MSIRVVIIGLDAASFTILEPWMSEGKLPNFKKIVDDGASGVLNSVIHPLSPAAWSSIITGKNPGKHGVYDWKIGERYVHLGDIKTPKLWDYLADDGKTIGIMNMPLTFPPCKVPGYLVSGILTPDINREFTYPPELKKEILDNVGDYRIDEKEVYKEGKEEILLKDYHNILENNLKVIEYLFTHHYKDVNFYVLMVTDHIQHKFWKYMDSSHPDYKESPFKDAIFSIYKRIDEFLGEFIPKLGNDTHLFILSDHGAGAFHKAVCINQWLMRLGLLKLKSDPITIFKLWMARTNFVLKVYKLLNKLGIGKIGLFFPKQKRDTLINSFLSLNDIDWKKTKAYSTGYMGKIFINLKGREPNGIVEPNSREYKELIEYIKEKLQELKEPETGERIVDEVYFKDELYYGPYTNSAPDIIFKMKGYNYVQSEQLIGPTKDGLFTFSPYGDSGQHRLEGIFIAYGSKIKRVKLDSISIMDIVPTVLYLLGCRIPRGLDGKIIKSIFEERFLEENSIREYDFEQKKEDESKPYTKEEEKELERRLKSLGYLG